MVLLINIIVVLSVLLLFFYFKSKKENEENFRIHESELNILKAKNRVKNNKEKNIQIIRYIKGSVELPLIKCTERIEKNNDTFNEYISDFNYHKNNRRVEICITEFYLKYDSLNSSTIANNILIEYRMSDVVEFDFESEVFSKLISTSKTIRIDNYTKIDNVEIFRLYRKLVEDVKCKFDCELKKIQ